jgi:hypothetical protein
LIPGEGKWFSTEDRFNIEFQIRYPRDLAQDARLFEYARPSILTRASRK